MNNNHAWDGAVSGMNTAADHAGSEWCELAYEFFCSFAKSHPDGFMTCDVIEAAEGNENLFSPDLRAWGSISKRAQMSGVVANFGYSTRTKGKAHASPRAVWKCIQK